MKAAMPAVSKRLERVARRSLWVVALLSLGGTGCWTSDAGPRAAIVVDPNPIDWGAVPWLETPKRTIVLTNRSNHQVMLRDPVPSCSCIGIVRGLGTFQLAPGRSTDFEMVLLSTKTEPRRFHKTLTIESDDPIVPKLDVPVIGSVTDFRQVSPRELNFGDVDTAANAVGGVGGVGKVEKTVEIRGSPGWHVSVVDVQSPDPRVEVENKPLADGADLVVKIKKGLDAAAKGPFDAQVRMTLEVKGDDGAAPRRYPESFWVRATLK
jgi:hypothetical protein